MRSLWALAVTLWGLAAHAAPFALPDGVPLPAGFSVEEHNSKYFDFNHEPLSYPRKGSSSQSLEPEGRTWSISMKITPPNKTGDQTDVTMRAAIREKGWEIYTQSGTLVAHRLLGGKEWWFKGAAFSGGYRAVVIEVGPPPHALTLPAPAARPESFGDGEDFPYLQKFPGSTLKRSEPRPDARIDVSPQGGPNGQFAGPPTIAKIYELPASVSSYERMVVYRDALTKAGWTVLRTAAGSDSLVIAHYANHGRDLFCYLHDGVFVVADVGAANEAKRLAEALAREGHVALYGIYFDTDQSKIKPESQAALEHILELLKSDAALKLEIQGHTDNTGTPAHNQPLSEQRAASVKQWLTDHQIAGSRLTARGYGESQPVGDNQTPEGRAKNRRVELKK